MPAKITGYTVVHFWLHHTAHCAEKIVSARLRAGSASAERVGQGEVGGVTGRVLCKWWLLGLALKRPWLALGGPPHALTAWTGLENTILTSQRAGILQERQGAVHMVAARLGFEKAIISTRWATPRPDCMDRLRKHYSHLAEGWYLARKAAWSLSGCMATNSADYYTLVNEWVWSKSRGCLVSERVYG